MQTQLKLNYKTNKLLKKDDGKILGRQIAFRNY